MEIKRLELVMFSALFILLSVLVFFVFRPFLYIIVLAIVLSVLFNPLYRYITKHLPEWKSVTAFFLVVVALVFLIIPILFFGLQILKQAQGFFSLPQTGKELYIQSIQQNTELLIRHINPNFSFNLSDYINKVLSFISSNLGRFLSQTAYVFFQTFFLLFAFFFFLRDGDKMLDSFISLSPFEKEQNKEIVNVVHRTITSVIRGTLFVGLIRLVLFTVVFYLFGIPNALLWGSIAGIVGTIPGLGTPFAIIPVFIYLLLYSNIFSAIAMGLFGVLASFFIDNLLSAYFFGKGLDVPAIFILFSILGGVFFFGPLGFIFGPIILSLFVSVIDMYKILVLKKV